MDNRIYALIGPHAVGKSRFARELINLGVHYIPYYTVKGIEAEKPAKVESLAVYLDKLEFFKTDFITRDSYKGRYVGIKKSDVLEALGKYRASLVLVTPAEVKQLSKLLKQNLETIYLMSDYVSIVERMLRLGYSNDEIKYHLEYAENNGEFDLWKIARHVVKNTGDPDTVMRQIMAIIGLTVPAPTEVAKEILGRND